MKPNTKELLLKFERIDWFCNAGAPLDVSAEVTPVLTWEEALAVCMSESSEAAYLEARSELTVQLSVRHGEAYKQWNSKVKELNSLVAKLLREKLTTPVVPIVIPNAASKSLLDTLTWDVLAMCMAHEYEDLVPRTKYYELLEHWYLAGRFPCGWIGEVPDEMENAFKLGKLAVL